MIENTKKYLIGQADKMTAWIGFIGLCLLLIGLHSALLFLFVLLIVLPEAHFSDVFRGWTQKLKELDKE